MTTSSLADIPHEEFQDERKIIWDNISLSKALACKIDCVFKAYGVSINSRTIREGDLFIAIKGKNFNGNDFALEALEKGAVAAIVSEIKDPSITNDKNVILVDDTLTSLTKMAKFNRARLKGKVVGVTGSVGKTSTKEMLKIAFQHQGNVFATEGSYNNYIGLPLSLARMHQDTDFAVIEMGMSHAGELSELSALAIPDIAIITNVEEVHLEFFKSVSAIADAKSEIFNSMQEGGFTLINFDNVYHKILTSKAQNKKLNIVGFSETHNTPAKLVSYNLKDEVSYIKAELFGKEYEYTINAPGKHLAFNSIAVLAAVKVAGAELDCAAYNLGRFKSIKGRGEIHYLNNDIILIDESYNASPVAVRAALSNLGSYKLKKGRCIAVLGNMADLGHNSPNFHKELGKDVILSVDKVFTVGDLMRYLYEILPQELRGAHTDNSEQMAHEIKDYIRKGDIILVKGRRTMEMEKIVEALID